MAAQQYYEQQTQRKPVDITFTVRGSRGYLTGSEVSNAMMKLTVVEFSYYMGFPVLQIAEREYNKRHFPLIFTLIIIYCFIMVLLYFSPQLSIIQS